MIEDLKTIADIVRLLQKCWFAEAIVKSLQNDVNYGKFTRKNPIFIEIPEGVYKKYQAHIFYFRMMEAVPSIHEENLPNGSKRITVSSTAGEKLFQQLLDQACSGYFKKYGSQVSGFSSTSILAEYIKNAVQNSWIYRYATIDKLCKIYEQRLIELIPPSKTPKADFLFRLLDFEKVSELFIEATKNHSFLSPDIEDTFHSNETSSPKDEEGTKMAIVDPVKPGLTDKAFTSVKDATLNPHNTATTTKWWNRVERLVHEGTGGIELEEALAQMVRDAGLGADVSTKIQATIAKLQRQGKGTDKILEVIKKDFDKALSDTQTAAQTHLGGLAPEQTAGTFSVHTPEAGPKTDYDNHSSNTGLHSFEIHVFDPTQQPVWIHERHPLNPSQTGMIVQTPGLPLNEQDMNRQGAVVPLTTGTIWLPSNPEIYIPDQHYYETKQPDRTNDIATAPAEFTPITPDEPAQKPFYQHHYVQDAIVSCTVFANAMVKDSGIYRALHNPEIAKMARDIHHKGIHKATFDLAKKMHQQPSTSPSTNTGKNTRSRQTTGGRRVASASSSSTKNNIRSNPAAKNRLSTKGQLNNNFKQRSLQNPTSQLYRNNTYSGSTRPPSLKTGMDVRGSSGGTNWRGAIYSGWDAPRCR